jgi:hypothetical protein
VRVGIIGGEVVKDVRHKEMGKFLQEALGEEVELSLFIGNGVRQRDDAFLDVVDL